MLLYLVAKKDCPRCDGTGAEPAWGPGGMATARDMTIACHECVPIGTTMTIGFPEGAMRYTILPSHKIFSERVEP